MDTVSISDNPQIACALFTAIPPEIRNYIFRLALSPSDDLDKPYSGHSFYYRPGYQYAHVSHTELLRTCRLVYAETRLLPWTLKEHVFWCHRGPKDSLNSPERYFKALTDEQIVNVRDVHIFAQSWWLEGNFPAMCLHTPMRMRTLKVTIRNSDWWYWEHNQMLSLKRNWTRNVSKIDGLEQMQLELEVVQRDRQQLMEIVKDVITWRMPLYDGRMLTTGDKPFVEENWLGTPHPEPASGILFDHTTQTWDTRRPPHQRYPYPPVTYVVITVRWTAA